MGAGCSAHGLQVQCRNLEQRNLPTMSATLTLGRHISQVVGLGKCSVDGGAGGGGGNLPGQSGASSGGKSATAGQAVRLDMHFP